MHGDVVYAASGSLVHCYSRGKLTHDLPAQDSKDIRYLLAFGTYLITLNTANFLSVWEVGTSEETLNCTIDLGKHSDVACIVHPPTYLNKIVIGRKDGTLEMWNIRVAKLVWKSTAFEEAVTTLVIAPVADVLAVGLLNGRIILQNIKYGEELFSVLQRGLVSSLTFRTDGPTILASSNEVGDVFLWDLNEHRLRHTMHCAHKGYIPRIEFLNNQPLLITAGTDNSVKEWIFDTPDGLPRLLRFRGGHQLPPNFLRFYGQETHFLLSCSQDRSMWKYSTRKDAQNREFSQGRIKHKLKTSSKDQDELVVDSILQFASELSKEKDWDNILTAHKGAKEAKTWSWTRAAMGTLNFATGDDSPVRSVAISACGNFGLVGSSKGCIDIYNMQSGMHRHRIRGHNKAVSGLAMDQLSKLVISASLDGTIKVIRPCLCTYRSSGVSLRKSLPNI